MSNAYMQVHQRICKTQRGELNYALTSWLACVSKILCSLCIFIVDLVKLGRCYHHGWHRYHAFNFRVLHTSFACAYSSQVFDLVFHHVYDTLEKIEIHHHNVYGTNKIYNNNWDFSEFCPKIKKCAIKSEKIGTDFSFAS